MLFFFRGFNSPYSAVVFYSSYFTSSSSSNGGINCKSFSSSSRYESIGKFSGIFWTFARLF